MSVKDLYDTGDSLFPQINVVPRNGQQCHLSYTYSGTILPSGFLYLSASDLIASTPPESALFTIRDQDNPLTEQYAVKIAPRSAQPTTLNLPGSTKSFSVKVASNSSSGTQSRTKDTIVVSIRDKSASTDTSVLVIQYPISAPSDIPQLNISLNSSTGVNTQSGNNVSRWSDGTTGGHGGHGGYSDALAQSDYDRQPTLVTNAVNGNPAIYFDHQTDNGDDGIYNSSFGQWADTPFTVFVVFSANSIPAGNRQTLLSTNTTDGFGLGIACNGKIGIFNDKPANTCPANDSASTNLAVMKDTWYVATFQSSLGITVGGNIRVQAWLNGTAGSQQMNLKTMSDAGLMIGTGGTDYGGSFDGYIAAFAIYERVLSGDERSLVERYLGSQYKITIH
jgi:hypothetical protein